MFKFYWYMYNTNTCLLDKKGDPTFVWLRQVSLYMWLAQSQDKEVVGSVRIKRWLAQNQDKEVVGPESG